MKRSRVSSRPLYEIFTEIAGVGKNVVKHGKIDLTVESDSDTETVSVDLDIDKNIWDFDWELEKQKPKHGKVYVDVHVNVDAEPHVHKVAGEDLEQDDVEIEDEDETVHIDENIGEFNKSQNFNIGDEMFKINNKWLRMENVEVEMIRCELEGAHNDENDRMVKEQKLRMKDFDDEGFRMDDAEVGAKINMDKKDEQSYTLSDIENYNRNGCVNNFFSTGGGFSSAYFTTESSKQSNDKFDDANSAFIGSPLPNVENNAKNVFSSLNHLASLGLANLNVQMGSKQVTSEQLALNHIASNRLALNNQVLNNQALNSQVLNSQTLNSHVSNQQVSTHLAPTHAHRFASNDSAPNYDASNRMITKQFTANQLTPDHMVSNSQKASHLKHLNLNPSHLNLDPSNNSIIQEKPCFLQIQITFNKFLAYIKTMRWTIAFIGHEFEYSPTRMGEILKLKNIKNGKRKFREWSKISDRMVDIMNNRALTMEYELLFQQFQGDYIKNSKQIKKRRKQFPTLMGNKFDRIEQSLSVLKEKKCIGLIPMSQRMDGI